MSDHEIRSEQPTAEAYKTHQQEEYVGIEASSTEYHKRGQLERRLIAFLCQTSQSYHCSRQKRIPGLDERVSDAKRKAAPYVKCGSSITISACRYLDCYDKGRALAVYDSQSSFKRSLLIGQYNRSRRTKELLRPLWG